MFCFPVLFDKISIVDIIKLENDIRKLLIL